MENNDYKIKASVLKSIMNNPSLRRTITDSLNAPLWSTKRAKARSILSAFNKVASKKQDGQWGPSLTTTNPGNFNFQAAAPLQNSYSNIRIFPNTPDPKPTGFGNWWSLSDFLSTQTKPTLPSSSQWLFNQGNQLNVAPGASVIKSGASIAWKTPLIQTQQEKLLSSLNKSAGISPLVNASPATFWQSIGKENLQGLMNTISSFNKQGAITPQAATPKITPVTDSASSGVQSMSWAMEWPSAPYNAGTTGTATATWPYGGDAAIQAQWDSLAPADQQKYKPVFDAAYSKLWAGTFFYGAMSDKNILKQMFPGLQEKDLPTGASLAWQMADLQSTLKNQYGLDTLLKQKTQLANETGNFKQDMTDYISGRDQMLSQVNKMIEEAENKSLDISTPYAADTMKNYTNYLYVLKGRQNKNYVDYLNTAINYQNNKVAQVDNEYTNMVNAYNTDFKTQSDIKTADYNQWYTVLTDMYNKLDWSLGSQLDIQQKQASLDKTYADIALSAAAAGAKNTTTKSWFEEMPQYKDYLIDSNTATKGQLLPWVDLASVIARASDNGLNPQGVLDTFQIGAKNSIAASKWDVNSLNSTMNNIVNTLRNFNSTTGGQYKDVIDNMAKWLWEQTQYQLSDYVANNSAPMVNAIKDLGNKKNSNVNDFIRNHTDLDAAIAKQLFNYYKSNPEYSNKPEAFFSSTWKISETDIPQIKDIIAKSIAGTWSNDIITSINQ